MSQQPIHVRQELKEFSVKDFFVVWRGLAKELRGVVEMVGAGDRVGGG